MRFIHGEDIERGPAMLEPEPRPGVPATALLLYRKPATVIATTFLHSLNEAEEVEDERFEFAEGGTDVRFVLQGERHHVIVEDAAEPATASTFAAALGHPFIDTTFPAARAIAEGHGAHVRIVVGGGDATKATETDLDALELADFEPGAMLPRLRLLRAAAHAYSKQRFPLAVHWCQCDNLLAGPDFVQMAERGAETELFVKAVPYSSAAETGAVYGAVTNGASNVIGREVELAEAPVPAAWAVDRLLQFVEKARSGVPAAGEALRFQSDEIVLVHDEPETPAFPNGHMRLTVEKLPDGSMTAAPAMPETSMGFLAEMDARGAARGFGRR